MAHDPIPAALAADYDALLAQLTTLRAEMSKLAAQITASASQHGAEMGQTVTHSLHDAKVFAGHKTHQAEQRVAQAVTANPFLAIGLAAGLGLILGAVARG